ncbi:MAG: hypothetical protein QHI38_09195 [Armatimonadota bacterium]|nr:hypothetical protein [Armatimonadota bacterium]
MLRMKSGSIAVLLLLAALSEVWCAAAPKIVPPKAYANTPIEFGVNDLKKALDKIRADVTIRVLTAAQAATPAARQAAKVLPRKAESFVVARVGKEIAVVGRDQVGAMYGCLELAERIDIYGRVALDIRKPIVQSPVVEFRAVNPFLTLPYKEDDNTWWFLQEDYWKGYLDQLARARINWIDLHGMYDIKTTRFPNIYPYFITSDRFPDVGVEPQIARRNLAMLNKVIRMAKARGIKFALMSYSAGWDGPGLRKPTSEASPENLAAYTREVVRKMIEQCPGLDMIGFRIGESGQREDFYRESYIPAIAQAGRKIALYTRTWGAKKDQILLIGREFPNRFFIEIKYNGEQFGPPYIVAGGRMKNWRDYSYQNYYSYPRAYKIIYQLRANGTHRVFPWGNPELAARANTASLLAGSIGLCIEPIDAYYPKYDFRHRNDSPNRWYKWQYERDWFWYTVWGRTAYDPSTAKREDLWIRMFEKRFGREAAADLYNAMKWASMIVPDAYTTYSLGPDHRNHAPELEWGGDVKAWSEGEPFDTQNIMSPKEYADLLVNSGSAARATPLRMASYLAEEARRTREYLEQARKKVRNPSPEFNDLTTDLLALSYLGDYYSHKLFAACVYALMRKTSDISLELPIRVELKSAAAAWQNLAKTAEQHYKPFVDTLRMHTEEFTWSKEGEKLAQDLKVLDDTIAEIKASGKTGKAPPIAIDVGIRGPEVASCQSELTGSGTTPGTKKLIVRVSFENPGKVDKVFLKTKPFPSDKGDWTLSPMTKQGSTWIGEIEVDSEGLMWCIEAYGTDGIGSMWPDFRKETPYRYVAPWEPK